MKAKKVMALALAAILLVCSSVAATVAYLTSMEKVVNTFTVGKVHIKLDEAVVEAKPDGSYKAKEDGSRTEDGNAYHLQPGLTYDKDPTVTVFANSENCYVRVLVNVEKMDNLIAAFPKASYPDWYEGDLFLLEKLVSSWDREIWACEGYSSGTYEFRYVGPKSENGIIPKSNSNTELEEVFSAIVIPSTMDNDAIANLQNAKITVVAHAIQADGFADADAAWGDTVTKWDTLSEDTYTGI